MAATQKHQLRHNFVETDFRIACGFMFPLQKDEMQSNACTDEHLGCTSTAFKIATKFNCIYATNIIEYESCCYHH